MTAYLYIESRDPFDSADSQYFPDLVKGTRERGHKTTLFLVQNGVLPARKGSQFSDRFRELAEAGIAIYADDFSLAERAIGAADTDSHVQSAGMDRLLDLLLEPDTKAVWH